MPTQHSTKIRGAFLDRVDVIHCVRNGEEIELQYESVHSETTQTIMGTVDDGHLSEWTIITTDDGARYVLMGNGMAGRKPGEVVRYDGSGRRRVGWFERAYRLETNPETENSA